MKIVRSALTKKGRAAVITVVLAVWSGCSASPRSVVWHVSFADPALEARASFVEALIVQGGCDGSPTIYAAVLGSSTATTPPLLSPGHYGLRARARDAQCQWFATGCVDVVAPVADDATFEVVLSAIDVQDACGGSECTNGVCAAGDAGPTFTPDGGGGADGGTGSGLCSVVSNEPALLYTFRAPGGDGTVQDEAAGGPSFALTPDPARAGGLSYGSTGVTFTASRLEATVNDTKRLSDAVVASNAFSIETWINPAKSPQSGLNRIVWSGGTSACVGLVHVDGNLEGWVRSEATSPNGRDAVGGGSAVVQVALGSGTFVHVVLAYDPSTGTAALYIDGALASQYQHQSGGKAAALNWDTATCRFALGDSYYTDNIPRDWRGTLRKVAVYTRTLSAAEVQALFAAGKDKGC